MSAEEITNLYGQKVTDLHLVPMDRVRWKEFFEKTDNDYTSMDDDLVEVHPDFVTISRKGTSEQWTWNRFFCSIAQWAWLFNNSADVFGLIEAGKAKAIQL